ncbi:DJ-1/PfpI family protein [Telmatospirillum siberiense]|uniref:AraC family transcriptional regulator n=1 Tax=Telmatospirillum siberiense TaxID=382514 RepID=A0A2N3PW85_9PROT|nr:DJ-1/PfpI family protein [Telmatospirillum siberiense]PKU24674.1 AraC family transcriptional regulator [Telmatospirillum siberiense]
MSLQIGILVFPAVQQLDLTGPYEIFASIPGASVHLIWKERAALLSSTGLALTPTRTFEETPSLDVLCIPGGAGVNALLGDEDVLDFVREKAAGAKYVTSVCTGALVLAAAGLLEGRRATTHWHAHDFLEKFGAVPVHRRVVRDGNLITAGGVTAGIDFALTVVAELVDQSLAEAIQLSLEYDPQPPYEAGTPEKASPDVVAAVKRRLAPSRMEREALIDRISGTKARALKHSD